MNVNRARLPLRRSMLLAFLLAAVLSLPPAVVLAAVDIREVWIEVYHPKRDGADKGYLVEVGLALEAGSDAPEFVTISPKAGSEYTLEFDEDEGEYIYFDGNGFDPSPGVWTGSGYTLSGFQAEYPDGTWTLAVKPVGGSVVNFQLPFQLNEANAGPSLFFPVHSSTIDTGKPVILFTNACTDCTGYEAEIESVGNDGVEKSFDTVSLPVGKKPNAVAFSQLGPNDGSSGTVDASGLAAGQYQSVVGLIKGVPSVTIHGSNSDDFELYVDAIRFDSGLFTVSGSTSTSASLTDVGMTMRQVKQVPSGTSYDTGWYFSVQGQGTGLGQAILFEPSSSVPIVLSDNAVTDFEYEQHLDSATNRADAFNVYLPTDGYSKYVLMVDGGKAMATLDFFKNDDPGPDADFSFVAPLDGEGVGGIPTFNLNIACTTCDYAELSIEDVASDGDAIHMVSPVEGEVPAGAAAIAFPGDFSANDGSAGTITSLPAGNYTVGALVFRSTSGDYDETKTLARSGTDSTFKYYTGENVERYIQVIPEPGMAALHLAALASLGGIARWRRRRSA